MTEITGPAYYSWSDFEKLRLKIGIIRDVMPNPKARKASYILKVDLGVLGIKTSSGALNDETSLKPISPFKYLVHTSGIAPRNFTYERGRLRTFETAGCILVSNVLSFLKTGILALAAIAIGFQNLKDFIIQ